MEAKDGWMARREARRLVSIRTKMRCGGPPQDVCIRDISSRGLCGFSEVPVSRGCVVEILHLGQPVVGQVVWASEGNFGVSVRQRIDVLAVVKNQGSAHSVRRLPADPLVPARPTMATVRHRHDRSRAIAAALEFGITVAGGALIAALLATTLFSAMSRPFEEVTVAMAAPPA